MTGEQFKIGFQGLFKAKRIVLLFVLLFSLATITTTNVTANPSDSVHGPNKVHITSLQTYSPIITTTHGSSNSDLAFSTYFDMPSGTYLSDMAVDSAGNSYITGYTNSTSFPVKNAFQSTLAGRQDAFLAKFSPTGQLLFSTYLGGTDIDQANAIAVDSAGNSYITGFTYSTNFPVRQAYQNRLAGSSNVFVAKFSPTGNLVFSTYLGGYYADTGYAIAVDSAGNSYITGIAVSSNFPSTKNVTFISSFIDSAFVSKFNSSGGLVYSRILDANLTTVSLGEGIAVDNAGNYAITGLVDGQNFPLKNALEKTNSSQDCFITKFNATNNIVFSTYFGGKKRDYCSSIAFDNTGNFYVTGYTNSSNFPIKNSNYVFNSSLTNGFISKFNQANQLVYSSYLVNVGIYQAIKLAVDNSGNAYILSSTNTTNFPAQNYFTSSFISTNVSASPVNNYEPFLVECNSSGTIIHSTLFLNQNTYHGIGLAVDNTGNIYIAGGTDNASNGNFTFYVNKFTSFPLSYTRSNLNSLLTSIFIGSVSGIVIVVIVVYIFVEFKKYSKLKKSAENTTTNTTTTSFLSYLKNRVKPKKKTLPPELVSDKTFEMLQEIIDESNK